MEHIVAASKDALAVRLAMERANPEVILEAPRFLRRGEEICVKGSDNNFWICRIRESDGKSFMPRWFDKCGLPSSLKSTFPTSHTLLRTFRLLQVTDEPRHSCDTIEDAVHMVHLAVLMPGAPEDVWVFNPADFTLSTFISSFPDICLKTAK